MLESRPTEEVYLVRDELANLVWGIETMIPLPSGGAKPGAEAAVETHGFFRRELEARLGAPPQPPPAAAPVRYRVMTSVPEHWIPFIPVHVEGGVREIQLQRAALPRTLTGDPDPPAKVRPRTVLMREGLDGDPPSAYLVHEQEATRAGVRLTQTYARTRWRDGRIVLWLGMRKQTGRGPSSSGLAFDRLIDRPGTSGGDRPLGSIQPGRRGQSDADKGVSLRCRRHAARRASRVPRQATGRT